MDPFWVNVNTFFGKSKKFTVDHPSIWSEPIAEFKMHCEIMHPLLGEVTLCPDETGCLIYGMLSGKVLLPCNRCAVNTIISIKHSFKNFEPFPFISEKNKNTLSDNDSFILRSINGIYEVSLANILWEEFILSLPLNILCSLNCKGLCFTCGKDLNKEDCICIKDKVDTRFDVLKTLKMNTPLSEHTKF